MRRSLLLSTCLLPLSMAVTPAFAEDGAEDAEREAIVVTGARTVSGTGTKTDTPITQTPQPVTVVTDDVYLAQGAISISDTLNYVSGVQANAYGLDSRIDGGFVRGIDPLQFRDGMRDIFSFYASIRGDPYNFSRVELVRGPASVLFGSSSIGGLLNLVSKTPEFETGGEVALRYGSFDRKELLADVTGPLSDSLAARLVVRIRDADTQTDFVPDDRVMVAPSLTWKPGENTNVTLLGLYQEDDGGSTAQFLPLYGTLYANPNGKLDNSTFIGKPGWDRYDGRLLQGTAKVDHRIGDNIKLSAKARYLDSDLTYLTHYPDNYTNPTNPFLDANQRIMGLYSDGTYARLEIFSTDNNAQFDFNTGSAIEHSVLAGVDYSWNRVRKTNGFGYETFDIYDIDYAALSNYGGGLPTTFGPPTSTDVAQKQLGFYLQDQIRLWDRVSIVLGGRRDYTRSQSAGSAAEKANATSLRAGIIAEVVTGVSPFASYTESFEPISGTASDGNPFKPKRGRQFEGGVKFHPDEQTLVTLTAYHIRETNRPVDDTDTPTPFDKKQAGLLTSKGFEFEASRTLPGNMQIIANYSYNKARIKGELHQLENTPKHNASLWATKSFDLSAQTDLRLGGGVRYSGANASFSANFPDGVRVPARTLVDALAEINWQSWGLSINATNLFNTKYYAACLARGDCFIGAERNVFGTLTYRF